MPTPTSAEAEVRSYVQRLENLLNERDDIAQALKELKTEIRSRGLNVKAMDRLVAIRRKDAADKESELLNDLLLYAQATGTQLDLAFPEPERAGAAA